MNKDFHIFIIVVLQSSKIESSPMSFRNTIVFDKHSWATRLKDEKTKTVENQTSHLTSTYIMATSFSDYTKPSLKCGIDILDMSLFWGPTPPSFANYMTNRLGLLLCPTKRTSLQMVGDRQCVSNEFHRARSNRLSIASTFFLQKTDKCASLLNRVVLKLWKILSCIHYPAYIIS